MRFITQTFTVLCILLFTGAVYAQKLNLNMEQLNTNGTPEGWYLGTSQHYKATVDTSTAHTGKYAIHISGKKADNDFGRCVISLPAGYTGRSITLKGFLKTRDIKDGYGGLWLRLDNGSDVLAFDNMNNSGLKGTNDWQEVSINLAYPEAARTIVLGALLVGDGDLWIDDLSLWIDGKQVTTIVNKIVPHYAAEEDTSFRFSSNIEISLDNNRLQALTALGQLWGFLKYHHPYIAAGNINWDAALIRILPEVLAATDKQGWQQVLEKWQDQLPAVKACTSCQGYKPDGNTKLQPDYGNLLTPGYLSDSHRNKLQHLLNNRSATPNYYVKLSSGGAGNAEFTNELAYSHTNYPDGGIRLLALYRYWNLIQYYYPYRNLTDNWNNALGDFIPAFVQAQDSTAYMLACTKLIGRIKDTHAGVNSITRRNWQGTYQPAFAVRFIENKLIVTTLLSVPATAPLPVAKGDEITHINGKSVQECITERLPYTPASNYAAQLRNMAYSILNGHTNQLQLTINAGKTVQINRYNEQTIAALAATAERPVNTHSLLTDNIGYLYGAAIKNNQLDSLKKVFEHTKGLIIDMRCYPSDFLPFTLGQWLKPSSTPFVYFTHIAESYPGTFEFGRPLENGGNKNAYKGKLVVLVDETTQSAAEYTSMALQTVPGVTIIGTTTAGADGNVSGVKLPGNIYSMISGIGVYYPDKSETQQTGIKRDITLAPTVAGFKAGKDEMLEKAISIINAAAAL